MVTRCINKKTILIKYTVVLICMVFTKTICANFVIGFSSYSNDEDSTFKKFSSNKLLVASAQINLLKTDGALLVRLKTNTNVINKLKASGSIDLATQVERETWLNNKNIVRAYTKEFTFCPVYFFYSTYSDSVKHKNVTNIFLDTNLVVAPAIVCNQSFYLIAEQGSIVSSSIGFVNEQQAKTIQQTGTEMKSVFAVVKNRYFTQLHQPFPYFQKGTGTKFKNYVEYVKKFNLQLENFYTKHKNAQPSAQVKEFIY